MAGEEARFAVTLEDNVSGAADAAQNALARLQSKMREQQSALSKMNAAMRQLKAASTPNQAAIDALSKRIEAQKQALAGSQAKFLELGGVYGRAYKATTANASATSKLGGLMAKMPGPLGQVGSALAGGAGAAAASSIAFAALGAAALAVVAAVGAAYVALVKFGVASASARREESLHFEGLSRMRRGFMTLRRAGGDEVVAALDKVAASSASSRGTLSRYAETLQRMGVRGRNLELALRGAATTAAAIGDEGGMLFARRAAAAARMGVSVERLADDAQARFGDIAAGKMLSLDVQASKMRESFGRLFSGIRLDPLLKGFQQITSLFSQSTASGRALKQLAEVALQPLIDAAPRAGSIVATTFKMMIIGGQRVAIGFLEMRNAALRAFIAIRQQIRDAGGAISGLAAKLSPLANIFGSTLTPGSASARKTSAQSGQMVVAGLAEGMRKNAPAILAARELGDATSNALRDSLEIRSPSRVFARLGREIPRGLSVGIEAESGSAQSSIDAAVGAPSVARASVGSGASITIGDIVINSTGGDAAALAEDLRARLSEILAGVAIEMGAA